MNEKKISIFLMGFKDRKILELAPLYFTVKTPIKGVNVLYSFITSEAKFSLLNYSVPTQY